MLCAGISLRVEHYPELAFRDIYLRPEEYPELAFQDNSLQLEHYPDLVFLYKPRKTTKDNCTNKDKCLCWLVIMFVLSHYDCSATWSLSIACWKIFWKTPWTSFVVYILEIILRHPCTAWLGAKHSPTFKSSEKTKETTQANLITK